MNRISHTEDLREGVERDIKELDKLLEEYSEGEEVERRQSMMPPNRNTMTAEEYQAEERRHTMTSNALDEMFRQCDLKEHDFQVPAMPLGVDGGTAAFFALQLTAKAAKRLGVVANKFVAKDLAHAADEIDFYNGL